MAENLVRQAAHNNATWCDAVCSTHSGPGEFYPSCWLNRHGVPRYYPDLVTLTGVEGVPAQTKALATLLQQSLRRSRSVKDSFNCLDLQAFGFKPLFSAKWLWAAALGTLGREAAEEIHWMQITDDADLVRWEQAWCPPAERGNPRTFRPSLLSRPDIQFICGFVDGVPVGGGILTAAAGVTGLSNLFASQVAFEVVLQGLVKLAATSFPGLPLVGYESGNDLAAAHQVGFRTIGQLRVWIRPGGEL